MDKVLTIGGKEVGFRATALTPRLYRHKIGRDIIQDFSRLEKAYRRAASLPETATEEERREAQLSARARSEGTYFSARAARSSALMRRKALSYACSQS